MSHPVAKTGFLVAVPAIVTGAVTMAPGILAMGTIGLQAYAGWRAYAYSRDVANGLSGAISSVKGLIGLGSSVPLPVVLPASNTTLLASTAAEYNETVVSMMSAAMMWRGWTVIANQFKSKHGKSKLAQLSDTSSANLKHALLTNGSSPTWKLAYFDKMGENAPEWLQTLSLDNKVLVGGFLAVLLAFFHTEGCMAMRENTRAMGTDYDYPLEAGLASESPADYLINPRRRCYNLYLKNRYYQKAGESDSMFKSPLQSNVFRIIANIMIGMLKTPGLLNTKTHDPVSVFLKFAEVTGYWEVLARLIGMYGWAPVYVTTHWLMRSLLTTKLSTKTKR
jgi:hypothetical protein